MTDTSVYVHFPWCLKKCPYCDFATRKVDRPDVPHRAYADAVLRELDGRAGSLDGRRLVSVFFGGGTPSLWDEAELGRVLRGIRGAFSACAEEVEVTVECNPSSLDRAKAARLRVEGVGRVSVGLQSLDDERLRFLGRFHDAEGGLRALREAAAEMPRVSADLMFGMPGQDPDAIAEDVQRVLDTGVQHVSAYALTIEPGTQFGELYRKGRLKVADEDVYADGFLTAESLFAAHGLAHYEVSNYAAPGEESRHNQHYWRGGAYLGLGAAAVGCLDEGVGRARRYRNEPEGFRYIERVPPTVAADRSAEVRPMEDWDEALGPEDIVREALMLGLRTADGVDLTATEARAGIDPRKGRKRALERRLGSGDVVLEDGWLRVPRERWLHLDGIVADLF